MKIDIRKMLRIDLLSAYLRHHEESDPDAADEWMQLNKVAHECGFTVETTTMGNGGTAIILLDAYDPDDEEMIQASRELYRLRRAITHNNPDIKYLDRWEPSAEDRKIMKSLGISWTTPSPKKTPEVVRPESGQPQRRRRLHPLAEQSKPAKQQRADDC